MKELVKHQDRRFEGVKIDLLLKEILTEISSDKKVLLTS